MKDHKELLLTNNMPLHAKAFGRTTAINGVTICPTGQIARGVLNPGLNAFVRELLTYA